MSLKRAAEVLRQEAARFAKGHAHSDVAVTNGVFAIYWHDTEAGHAGKARHDEMLALAEELERSNWMTLDDLIREHEADPKRKTLLDNARYQAGLEAAARICEKMAQVDPKYRATAGYQFAAAIRSAVAAPPVGDKE